MAWAIVFFVYVGVGILVVTVFKGITDIPQYRILWFSRVIQRHYRRASYFIELAWPVYMALWLFQLIVWYPVQAVAVRFGWITKGQLFTGGSATMAFGKEATPSHRPARDGQ